MCTILIIGAVECISELSGSLNYSKYTSEWRNYNELSEGIDTGLFKKALPIFWSSGLNATY